MTLTHAQSSTWGGVTRTQLVRARIATFFGYFQIGVALNMWSSSTSSLQRSYGWIGSDGTVDALHFGMLTTAIGVGAVIGSFLTGPLADRYGPRMVIWPLLVLFPASFLPLALTNSFVAALVLGVAIGLVRGGLDTATGALAIALERHYERPLMAGFQAIFPIGGFLGGWASSGLIVLLGVHDSPLPLYAVEGLILAGIGAVVGGWVLRKDQILPADHQNHKLNSVRLQTSVVQKGLPALACVLGGMLVLSMWVESSLWDWGQTFGVEVYGSTTAAAAVAISFFSLGEFAGRMISDRLVMRFGEVRVLLVSGLIGIFGALVLILGRGDLTLASGMFLVGVGVASMAPVMLSSAGRLDPANAGRSIGIVTGIGYVAMLAGPLGMTVVVSAFGSISIPFVALALLVLIVAFSPMVSKVLPAQRSAELALSESAR
ncbi:sugar MFS transporter [Paenarthrobacter sp. A20]|uniref:MFS transporter n=1 Tax=Paenarthrobacter sp. A20 TaxID=2817891 RepID=UPI0020A00859|nr:MFS transporter [Paenarthrobacter sp. A20]MCP1412399.1 MFS family permease [Paenarthrobacter sp. A20]